MNLSFGGGVVVRVRDLGREVEIWLVSVDGLWVMHRLGMAEP